MPAQPNNKQFVSPVARAALVTLAALSSLPVLAQDLAPAQSGDPVWRLGVSQEITHDSNVNRASDALARSDWVSTTGAELRLSVPLSRQRLTMLGVVEAVRFRNQDEQNDVGYRLQANLDWDLPSQFSGTAGAELLRRRFLGGLDVVSPGDTQDQSQNLWLTARKAVAADWRLDGAVRAMHRSVTPAALNDNDQRQWSGEFGAAYNSNPDLSLGLLGRATKGSYPNLPGGGDDYKRADIEGSVVWQFTGASALDAQLGVARESHTIASAEDTTNAYGSATLRWMPSDKLTFSLMARRDRNSGVIQTQSDADGTPGTGGIDPGGNPLFDLRSTNALINTVQLQLQWGLSAFISLNGGVTGSQRSFADMTGASGNDRQTGAWFGFTYLPLERLELGCRVTQERRSADPGTPSFDYSQTTYGCLGRYWFGT